MILKLQLIEIILHICNLFFKRHNIIFVVALYIFNLNFILMEYFFYGLLVAFLHDVNFLFVVIADLFNGFIVVFRQQINHFMMLLLILLFPFGVL